MRRARDTSWHERWLAELSKGLGYDAAARKVGVSESTMAKHVREDGNLRHRAQAARRPDSASRVTQLVDAGLSMVDAAWVLSFDGSNLTGEDAAERAEWPVDVYDLLRLARNVAAGMDLQDACEAASIPKRTVTGWRRRFARVDEVIVAAAADGRTRKIKPLPGLVCPGPHCGKKTGYDYGCDKAPCRDAVAARERQRRHNEQEMPHDHA